MPCVEAIDIDDIQSGLRARATAKEQGIDISDLSTRKNKHTRNQSRRDNVYIYSASASSHNPAGAAAAGAGMLSRRRGRTMNRQEIVFWLERLERRYKTLDGAHFSLSGSQARVTASPLW